MKKNVVAVWGSMLVLGLAPACGVRLSAQTTVEVREIQALQEHLSQVREHELQELQERLAQVREHELQAHQERLAQVREHDLQELQERLARERERTDFRIQEVRIREDEARRRAIERAVQARVLTGEARERAERAAERAQQVIVQYRSRARIGVSLDARQGRDYDGQGALVKGVMDASPAEEAGIQEGDIITHLDGHSLLDPLPQEQEEELDEYQSLPVQRLMALAKELEDGQDVEVRYLRDGTGQRVSLKAAELKDVWSNFAPGEASRGMVFHFDPEEGRTWTFRTPEGRIWSRELEELEDLEIEVPEIHLEGIRPGWTLGSAPNIRIARGGDALFLGLEGAFTQGLSLRKLTPELGAYFSTDTGVLVLDVEEESDLGLLPGDVILSIDGRDVEDQGDVIRILRSYETGEVVAFRVMRHGQETRVQGTAR